MTRYVVTMSYFIDLAHEVFLMLLKSLSASVILDQSEKSASIADVLKTALLMRGKPDNRDVRSIRVVLSKASLENI